MIDSVSVEPASADPSSLPTASTAKSPVHVFNEWDPLEEVIVGVVERSVVPAEDRRTIEATMPERYWDFFFREGGRLFPREILDAARREVDELVHILENEGVKVRRPAILDWPKLGGHSAAMPRDSLFALGAEVIEAPMAWRSRQKEMLAYRPLLEEYQRGGATWISAPRVGDPDSLLEPPASPEEENGDWLINDRYPAFDAADFLRFGRDVIGQLSNVTNPSGVEWLERHLAPEYRMHILDFNDPHAMHIDATLMPLRPGFVIANPKRVDVPALKKGLFKGWDVVTAPDPVIPKEHPLYMTSNWINMNVLSLDHERVMIEAEDEPMKAFLEEHGFRPILCPLRNFNCLGGSFHCATLDVRRTGELGTYLSV